MITEDKMLEQIKGLKFGDKVEVEWANETREICLFLFFSNDGTWWGVDKDGSDFNLPKADIKTIIPARYDVPEITDEEIGTLLATISFLKTNKLADKKEIIKVLQSLLTKLELYRKGGTSQEQWRGGK